MEKGIEFIVAELSDLDKELLSWIAVYQPISQFPDDFQEFIKQSGRQNEQIVLSLKRLFPMHINYSDVGLLTHFMATEVTITKVGLAELEQMVKEKSLPETAKKILITGKEVLSFAKYLV